MWINSRQHSGLPALRIKSNFVLVDDQTFEEFQMFKSMHIKPDVYYIPTSELIDLYYAQTRLDPILSTKFNVTLYASF